MSEISVQFKNSFNGYNKEEVNEFLKQIEERLQERAVTIDSLQQQVAGLEAKLEQVTTPEALEAAKKVELYDQLMKKMGDEFENLLAPALAKKKAIEEQAERDYELRMDQAKQAAEGIYAQAAERIAEVVDQNMARLYELLDDYIYSKTLPGRVESFMKACDMVSMKIATGIVAASKVPGKAYSAVSAIVQEKVEQVKATIENYKQKKAVEAEASEDEDLEAIEDAE